MLDVAASLALLMLLAIGSERPGARSPPMDPIQPVTEGYFPGADGARLFYRLVGSSGDTLVVLHGGPGGDLENVAPDLAPLAADHVLLLYDQRGGGRSDPLADPDALTAEHHVRDLEALRQHFGLERLRLVGHSWGSGLAALYAMAHPEQVAGMVLIGSLPPTAVPWMEEFGRAVEEALGPEAMAQRQVLAERWMAGEDPRPLCRAFWELMMPIYARGRTAPRAEMCAAPVETLGPFFRLSRATLLSLGAWDWRDGLMGVTAPALVVHGEHDPIPLASARVWAESLPDAELLAVEGAAHFPHAEEPAVVFAALRGFFRSISN